MTTDLNRFFTILTGLSGPQKGALSYKLISALQAFFHGFKIVSNLVVKGVQLLYDIFLAGVSSPVNILMNILLFGLSSILRLFNKKNKEVLAQDCNYSNIEGPPPGPEFKKIPLTNAVSRKERDDTSGSLSSYPTTYSFSSSSIPTKVIRAHLKKNSAPLLIMAVPVQYKESGVHETPHRSLIRSFFRTVCLCLTILALAPISQFDRYSVQNMMSKIQGGEVLRSLKLQSHAVGASIAQLLDNWFKKREESKDLAAIPKSNPDRVYLGRYNPNPVCPFFKKSKG